MQISLILHFFVFRGCKYLSFYTFLSLVDPNISHFTLFHPQLMQISLILHFFVLSLCKYLSFYNFSFSVDANISNFTLFRTQLMQISLILHFFILSWCKYLSFYTFYHQFMQISLILHQWSIGPQRPYGTPLFVCGPVCAKNIDEQTTATNSQQNHC